MKKVEKTLNALIKKAEKKFNAPKGLHESNDDYGKRRLYFSTLIHELDEFPLPFDLIDKIISKEELIELAKSNPYCFKGKLIKGLSVTTGDLDYQTYIYISNLKTNY